MFKRWDNVTKVSLIYFFSCLYFYLPVLTIYYQQKGLNFLQIGSLSAIITFTIFFANIPTGIFADKFGRRNSIILAMLFQLFGEILFLFARSYIYFVFINIIAGLGFAFQSGCIQAIVYDFLKDQNREKDMKKSWGRINVFGQAGFIIGALISSFIITSQSSPQIIPAIILTVISVFIAFMISFTLKEPSTIYAHTQQSPIRILKTSFEILKDNKNLRRVILFSIFTTPFLPYLNNFQPPYFQLAHIPLTLLGLTRSIAGILAVVFLHYAYKLEDWFKVNGIFIATIIPGLLYICMAFILNPVFAAMLFVFNYSSMRLQDPLLADYSNIHIKSEVRSTVLSAIGMLSSLYFSLMGLITGKLADYSLSLAFLVMGLIILVGSIAFKLKDEMITPNINTRI